MINISAILEAGKDLANRFYTAAKPTIDTVANSAAGIFLTNRICAVAQLVIGGTAFVGFSTKAILTALACPFLGEQEARRSFYGISCSFLSVLKAVKRFFHYGSENGKFSSVSALAGNAWKAFKSLDENKMERARTSFSSGAAVLRAWKVMLCIDDPADLTYKPRISREMVRKPMSEESTEA